MSGDLSVAHTDLTGIRAVLGTCTTVKSAGVATVTINGTDVAVQVARDLTVAVGDVVLVQKVGSQRFAVQRFYTAAPAAVENIAPPPPKPAVVYGTTVCSPVETRSYRNSAWRTDTTDVYQGQYGGNGNNTGCAFYGSKPHSLAGATADAAWINVRRQSAGGNAAAQSTTLRLVTQKTLPAGAPTLTSTTPGPVLKWGQTDTGFAVPTSWAQSMIDGTAGGLAVFDATGSPYVILDGRGDYSPAFTLTIQWHR